MVYTRKLGKSNREVSALGMGCWGIGGPFKNQEGQYLAYGDVDDKESIKTVQTALYLGINFFDTADVYGCGHSEKILGQALKDEREDVVIATKFGSTFDPETRTTLGKNFSPEYINKAVNDSLRRLQTNYIDIYQLHDARHDSENALVIRDILEDLVNEGKIRYYGWSTDDPERAKEFAKGENCLAIQYILNILRNNTPIAEICEIYDLAGIIRQPMQSGILSGKYTKDTKRASNHFYANADFTTERYEKIFNSLNFLEDVLKNNDLTMVQTALSYIWAKNNRAIPIPGAKTVEQITENAKTLESGPISQKFMREIDSIFKELHHDFSHDNFEYYKTK
ncbi:MAG: aldo/keto reductase [Candidatus Hodarchaeales archaeon]|jgi:aryl-alcohol dehydrogenase-like predicted oxidoreductase